MIQRCRNAKHPSYRLYGGRGITVCEAWRHFNQFLADMGQRPSSKHTLERVNSNGPYTPDNCRWATRLEQNRNTSRNRYVTFNGRTQTVMEWALELGINHYTLYKRVVRWPIQRAMTMPVGPNPYLRK